MRLGWAALALSALVLLQSTASADIADPGSPTYANNILSDFVTPTIRPGDSLEFSFNVSNPYDDPDATMTGVVLTIGIYRYATQEEVRDVDDGFPSPPQIEGGDTEKVEEIGSLAPNSTERVELVITTTDDTPHGSYFLQSTYFVRFSMAFTFEGNETPVVLKSRGCFSDEEWDEMVSFSPEESIVNTTYMHELGVDGLIPDSSFGIKIPIPRWPLALLIVGCCAAGFMATFYFVLDNPGRYPRLEKRFYQLRGKASELRSKLKHGRGKG